jgi:hypothetical protein
MTTRICECISECYPDVINDKIEPGGKKRMKDNKVTTDPYKIGVGLRSIRRRRKLLWGVILLYAPEMWATIEITHSNTVMFVVFCLWFIVLCNATVLTAFARCPRCGNYFHMQGFVVVYLRTCRHCRLHLCADKE